MKKALSIILTLVMLFGVVAISASAAEPAVKIITNEGSSIVVGDETYFTVRFDGFTTIKGMDVDVSVTNASELALHKATGFTFAEEDKLEEGENYKTDGTTSLKLVDLTGQKDGTLIFKVTPNAVGAKVTVDGEYAKSGSELVDVEGDEAILDVVATTTPEEVKIKETTTLAQPTNDTFIPYGSVVDANGEFAEKNAEDGSFTLKTDKEYTYSTFAKPSADVGLTTYGITHEKANKDNFRFGTYSVLGNTYSHGTLVFEGNWKALKYYYIQKGHTVQEFVKAIYKNAKSKIGDHDFVKYNIPGVGEINVYIVPQTKVMWQSGNELEYAVRINGANAGTTYTGVAYSYSDTDLKISDNVRSITAEAVS